MTQNTINIFMNEIYSKRPKKNYITNKTEVYDIDDIWSLDILDLEDLERIIDVLHMFWYYLTFLLNLDGVFL